MNGDAQYEGMPISQLHCHLRNEKGNWDELTSAKTSRTVTRDRRKNWLIADRYVTNNDPRSNCGTRLGSSSPVVCKVANQNKKRKV